MSHTTSWTILPCMTQWCDHTVIHFDGTLKKTSYNMFSIFLFDDIVKTHNPLKWTFACFLVNWYQARCFEISLWSQVTHLITTNLKKKISSSNFPPLNKSIKSILKLIFWPQGKAFSAACQRLNSFLGIFMSLKVPGCPDLSPKNRSQVMFRQALD